MRDRDTIDSELRRLAVGRRSIREQGGQPSIDEVDELLDERLGYRTKASETAGLDIPPRRGKADATRPLKRKGLLRRFGLLAALPLSLVAIATVVLVMFAFHHSQPAAQPADVPPPPSARPNPAPPQPHAPPSDLVDRALIEALKHDGVPIPSAEYVTTHGHAVCDFLTQQPNLAEAVSFVQRSSIWDANQSANVTAGAVVSYCPQYEAVSPVSIQPGVQNALSDLQAVEGDLQSIQGDLQGIRDDLQALPGHP